MRHCLEIEFESRPTRLHVISQPRTQALAQFATDLYV